MKNQDSGPAKKEDPSFHSEWPCRGNKKEFKVNSKIRGVGVVMLRIYVKSYSESVVGDKMAEGLRIAVAKALVIKIADS